MSIVLHESASSKMKEILIKELIQGKEYATQLKFMFENHVDSNGSASVKELVCNVLRTFSQTISVMTSSEACNFDEVAQNHNSGEDGSLVAASCNDDVKSEDSSESKKRLLPTTKDRRGSYKRRKTDETRTIVSKTIGDNHSWRKYGQKEILNSQFPRSYFRCTRKHEQGCKATKQVQLIEENPEMYQITYIGYHTCKASLQTPQMVAFSAGTNWDSFTVNPHSKEVLVNYDQQVPPISSSERPVVKQEYLNNDDNTTPQRSDLTDNLLDEHNLWSDFKDLELPKPSTLSFNNVAPSDNNADNVYSCTESQNLEIDFGSFSDFSNDLVYFDESQLL
ncbi:probable WRKY transcription factor 70 [Trifolium pratense]|nr:probable WRKY transcription factor 70 [Trifolium pratense]